MSMIRPIVFAHTLLHSTCATGQILRRFFRSIDKIGYHPYIICNNQGDVAQSDISTCDVRIIPFNKFAYFWTRSVRHSPWPYILNTPDQFRYCWMNRARRAAEKLINEGENFDFVYTISMPSSQHLPGLKLKRRYGIPWVAHFYDPWIGNTNRELKNKKFRELDAAYELEVAKYADIIIHPCQAVVDDWHKRYGDLVRGKLFVLPFIGESDEHCLPPHLGDNIVISHIGNLMHNRNTITFIKAIDKLVSLNPKYRTRLKVNYIGKVTDEEKVLIKEKKLEEIFNLVGSIPEKECEPYYEESDIFLIVDMDCQPNLFYPSKLIKYFGYKKPILGICTKQSVIKDELNSTGNHAFEYYDVDGVCDFVARALDDYSTVCTNNTEYWKIFKIDNVLNEYDKIIREHLM